ncbi:MAG: hypothetical protein ABII26_11160 [Pseudomonadota bacterium]
MIKGRLPLLILCLSLLAGSVCGKKGPPHLPQNKVTASVVDLKAEWKEGSIFIKGKINGPEGLLEPRNARDQIMGARVYYNQYPPENAPCDGCPIEYPGYHEFGSEVITDEGFACQVPGKNKGQIYFFKIHLIGQGGAIGPPSDKMKFVVE